jgi:hypothetical protein
MISLNDIQQYENSSIVRVMNYSRNHIRLAVSGTQVQTRRFFFSNWAGSALRRTIQLQLSS